MQPENSLQVRVAEFHKLLAWYPAQWRAKNETEMLSVLLEDAQNRGLDKPKASDKLAIRLSGLRQRLVPFERVPIHARVLLFIGLIYSLFYSFVISWSPGIHAPGSLGPFANPSMITGALIALAWMLAIFNAGMPSRRISAVAFYANLIIVATASYAGWLGPSPWAALIFAFVTAFAWVLAKPGFIQMITLAEPS